MRVGIRDAERLKDSPSSAPVCALGRLSLSPLSLRDIIPTPFGLRPFPPDRGNRPLDKGSRPPVGGRLWVRLNREEMPPLWDVWIHILGIGAECACWGGGRPGVPPLRRKRGKPGRCAESSRPTKGVSGACPLIRPLRGHLPPRGKAFGEAPLSRLA